MGGSSATRVSARVSLQATKPETDSSPNTAAPRNAATRQAHEQKRRRRPTRGCTRSTPQRAQAVTPRRVQVRSSPCHRPHHPAATRQLDDLERRAVDPGRDLVEQEQAPPASRRLPVRDLVLAGELPDTVRSEQPSSSAMSSMCKNGDGPLMRLLRFAPGFVSPRLMIHHLDQGYRIPCTLRKPCK